MADHSKPVLTSAYADFVTELDGRFDDLAVGLDPAVTTATNVPTNSIRFSSAAGKWQKFNGSTWGDLVATYAISISGNAATVTNGVVTTGSYSDPAWITSIAGSKVAGAITGNAASATVLQTARTINGVSFNGSANISINLNNNLTFNNAGSGAASGVNFSGSTATTISYNTIGAPSTTGTGASGTWGISISGNAATVTNGVVITGSYSDPSWITSLAGSKITGTVASATAATSATTAATCSGNSATATALTTASGSAPSYSARAWVNFDGTGTDATNQTIRAAGNVSSVYKNGMGDYVLNFSTALPSANYAVALAATDIVGGAAVAKIASPYNSATAPYTMTSTQLRIAFGERGVTYNVNVFTAVIFH